MKTTEDSVRVAVIGGGASGMMAAIAAAKSGAIVTIFESKRRLGSKLLLTGNGRCNFSNRSVTHRNYHGSHPKFVASVFARVPHTESIRFFSQLGFEAVDEGRGRLFPRNGNALDILKSFEKMLADLNVAVNLETPVVSIKTLFGKFVIETQSADKLDFDKVILSTGGKSIPQTGSKGDGSRFAKLLGHAIVEEIPVSSPIKSNVEMFTNLAGVTVDVRIRLLVDGERVSQDEGGLLFTHYGVSGPVVLRSSRHISPYFFSHDSVVSKDVTGELCFIPTENEDHLRQVVLSVRDEYPNTLLRHSLKEYFPSRLVEELFKVALVPLSLTVSEISKKQLSKLLHTIFNYSFTIDGVFGWDQAQFTQGGVDVTEINSETMSSKIVQGLYFAGESVDIYGDTGGYNLQWAWSSGWLAGESSVVNIL